MSVAPHLGHPTGPGPKGRVAGVDRRRKRKVGGQIVMPRTDQRFGRQRHQPLQAVPHLCRRPLEQPPAACGHQAVTGKHQATAREVKRDVPDGMARHVDDPRRFAPDGETHVGGQRQIQRRQPVRVRRSAQHHRPCGRAQRVRALHMVGMVVRQQDVGQTPSGAVQCGQHRGGIGHIDTGGLAAVFVMDQEGEVVGQAGNRFQVKRHGLAPVR